MSGRRHKLEAAGRGGMSDGSCEWETGGRTVHVRLGADGGMAGQDCVDVIEHGIGGRVRLDVLAQPLVG